MNANEAREKFANRVTEYLESIDKNVDLAIEGAIKRFSRVARLNFNESPTIENKDAIINLLKEKNFTDIDYKVDSPRQGEQGNTNYYIIFRF